MDLRFARFVEIRKWTVSYVFCSEMIVRRPFLLLPSAPRWLRVVGVVCFCAGLAGLSPSALGQVVIVHPSITDEAVSRSALRAIFSGRLQSLSGQRLTVFVLDDLDPLHSSFSKEVLGVFPYQLRAAWNRAVFAGSGRAPVTVNSEQEMLRRVADTVGAVGYVSERGHHQGVRTLDIKGAPQ